MVKQTDVQCTANRSRTLRFKWFQTASSQTRVFVFGYASLSVCVIGTNFDRKYFGRRKTVEENEKKRKVEEDFRRRRRRRRRMRKQDATTDFLAPFPTLAGFRSPCTQSCSCKCCTEQGVWDDANLLVFQTASSL